MTTKRHLKLGQLTALVSFLVGTLIFILYYLTSASELLFVGYWFIALAGLLNFGLLIAILAKARKDVTNQKKLLNTSGLMLLNIPVMIAYCWGVIMLTGTMRINFTNKTDSNLSDIKIVGCGGGHIDKLKIGESKTVWVEITGDCSIRINYLSNGKLIEETVVGYVTYNMGQKAKHKIDGKDKELFL